MRQLILVVVGVSLLAAVAASQTKLGTAADEAAIQKNQDARVAAWNKHDAHGVAATYAPDADRIAATQSASNRNGIEKDYAAGFAGVNKNATLKLNTRHVRFLTSDVALTDADDVITGRTDGTTLKQHVVG